jgi:hypothetical protein
MVWLAFDSASKDRFGVDWAWHAVTAYTSIASSNCFKIGLNMWQIL